MSRCVAVIEARMSSSRLPGKVLMPAGGKPLLAILIGRLKRARSLDDIVVATTENPADGAIESLCRELGVRCFRGSEENVLERVCGAVAASGAEILVEITADCPLLDPALVDEAVEFFCGNYPSTRYVSNGAPSGNAPIGMCVQVFTAADLAAILADNPSQMEREHVSHRFYSGEFDDVYRPMSLHYAPPVDRPDVWVTLDYREDYEMICALYEEVSAADGDFGIAEVVAWVDRHPEMHAKCKALRDL